MSTKDKFKDELFTWRVANKKEDNSKLYTSSMKAPQKK